MWNFLIYRTVITTCFILNQFNSFHFDLFHFVLFLSLSSDVSLYRLIAVVYDNDIIFFQFVARLFSLHDLVGFCNVFVMCMLFSIVFTVSYFLCMACWVHSSSLLWCINHMCAVTRLVNARSQAVAACIN